MATVPEIFAKIKAQVEQNPARIASLNGSYQFEITGEGGGTYHAAFNGGDSDIGPGAIADAGCTVTASAADFVALAEGRLNPMAAFMSGKLKVKGDMSLAMKLQSVLV